MSEFSLSKKYWRAIEPHCVCEFTINTRNCVAAGTAGANKGVEALGWMAAHVSQTSPLNLIDSVNIPEKWLTAAVHTCLKANNWQKGTQEWTFSLLFSVIIYRGGREKNERQHCLLVGILFVLICFYWSQSLSFMSMQRKWGQNICLINGISCFNRLCSSWNRQIKKLIPAVDWM